MRKVSCDAVDQAMCEGIQELRTSKRYSLLCVELANASPPFITVYVVPKRHQVQKLDPLSCRPSSRPKASATLFLGRKPPKSSHPLL